MGYSYSQQNTITVSKPAFDNLWKGFLNVYAEPDFESAVLLDYQNCVTVEAGSPAMDYYIDGLENYYKRLVEIGTSAVVAQRIILPMLSIFTEAKRFNLSVNLPCSSQRTTEIPSFMKKHPQPDSFDWTIMTYLLDVNMVPLFYNASEMTAAGWFNPDSNTLVILLPSKHNSLYLGFIRLLFTHQLMQSKGPSAEVYLALELPETKDTKARIPKGNETKAICISKKMDNFFSSALAPLLGAPTDKQLLDKYKTIALDKTFFDISMESTCALNKKCPTEDELLLGHLEYIADRFLQFLYPVFEINTWKIEDANAYYEDADNLLDDPEKYKRNYFSNIEKRTQLSVERLMEKIEDANSRNDKPRIIIVSQGFSHIPYFIEAMKGHQDTSFVYIVPPRMALAYHANDEIKAEYFKPKTTP